MNGNVVWSKDRCPYCHMAKDLLKAKGIEFEERNMSEEYWTKDDLFESIPHLRTQSGITLPQITLLGEYIGGFDDLYAHFRNSNDSLT